MSDFQVKGEISLDTSALSSGITGAAIAFDAIVIAAEKAMAGVQKAYDATLGKTLEMGEEMVTAAAIAGDSVENMQRLRNAAVAVDVSFESVTTSMRMMTQKLDLTTTSGQELNAKLAAIGVQTTDVNGKMRSSTDIFMDTNAALGRMPDVFQRNQLAMDIYGRGWSNIVKFITDADVTAGAFATRPIISTEQLERAEDLGDKFNVIKDNVNMLGVNIGTELLPALGDLEISLNSMPSLGEGMTDALKLIDDELKAVIFTVTSLVFGLREVEALSRRDFAGAKNIREEYGQYIDDMKAGTSSHAKGKNIAGMTQDKNGIWVSTKTTSDGTDSPPTNPDAGVSKVDQGALNAKYASAWGVPAELLALNSDGTPSTYKDGSPVINQNATVGMTSADGASAYGSAYVGGNATSPYMNPGLGYLLTLGNYQNTYKASNASEMVAMAGGQSSTYDDQIRSILAANPQASNGYDVWHSNLNGPLQAQLEQLLAKDKAWRPDTSNITIINNNGNATAADAEKISAATVMAMSRALAESLGM